MSSLVRGAAGHKDSQWPPRQLSPVGILGGTGLVGRMLARALCDHPFLCCGPIVGSSRSAGQKFEAIWHEKEDALQSHYGDQLWTPDRAFPAALRGTHVSTIDELIDSDCDLVISAVAPRLGFLEDKLKEAGITVVSISPYKRQESALCVLEANHTALRNQLETALEQLQKEVSQKEAVDGVEASQPSDIAAQISAALPQPLPLVKSPNCVCCGTSTVLAGLASTFGKMENVSVTTFQSLSGRGDSKYPAELVVGNVFPLRSTTEPTEELIGEELATVLCDQLSAGRDSVSVAAYRVSVQRGHLVDVRVRFEDSASFRARLAEAGDDEASRMEVVYKALEEYRPLEVYRQHLPSVPEQPIIVDRGAGCPRPKSHHLGSGSGGFSVTVGNVKCVDGPYDVCLSLVVDNLVKGALGAALQLLEYTLMLTEKKM